MSEIEGPHLPSETESEAPPTELVDEMDRQQAEIKRIPPEIALEAMRLEEKLNDLGIDRQLSHKFGERLVACGVFVLSSRASRKIGGMKITNRVRISLGGARLTMGVDTSLISENGSLDITPTFKKGGVELGTLRCSLAVNTNGGSQTLDFRLIAVDKDTIRIEIKGGAQINADGTRAHLGVDLSAGNFSLELNGDNIGLDFAPKGKFNVILPGNNEMKLFASADTSGGIVGASGRF